MFGGASGVEVENARLDHSATGYAIYKRLSIKLLTMIPMLELLLSAYMMVAGVSLTEGLAAARSMACWL